MTELYLIAHKVRGERAFDIAERMDCPECESYGDPTYHYGCTECDGLGFWWIIPTSGHRAYPYWSWDLEATELNGGGDTNLPDMAGPMPEGIVDHYLHGPAPRVDIRALFKKSDWVPAPEAFIPRRL